MTPTGDQRSDVQGNGQKEGSMSTTTEDLSKLQEQVKGLEVSQAGQAASLAGAQMTQAAAQAGTWSTMAAGMGGFVIGIFLGIAISNSGRR
jgi:hypothetical protein